jgi:hypothetical protein
MGLPSLPSVLSKTGQPREVNTSLVPVATTFLTLPLKELAHSLLVEPFLTGVDIPNRAVTVGDAELRGELVRKRHLRS